MSKGDPVALLGRGAVLHKLGQYAAAASDYGAVVAKSPADVQPYWLRYGLELWQVTPRSLVSLTLYQTPSFLRSPLTPMLLRLTASRRLLASYAASRPSSTSNRSVRWRFLRC